MEINFHLSPSAKQHQNPCSGPSPAYQDLSTCRDWPVKKAIVNLPIKLEIHVNKIPNTFPVSHLLVRDPEQGYQHRFADVTNHC